MKDLRRRNFKVKIQEACLGWNFYIKNKGDDLERNFNINGLLQGQNMIYIRIAAV